MDCSLLGSSVHGILKARILEWVVISFSRGSCWSRKRTQVSCIAGRFLTDWATRKSLLINKHISTEIGLLFFNLLVADKIPILRVTEKTILTQLFFAHFFYNLTFTEPFDFTGFFLIGFVGLNKPSILTSTMHLSKERKLIFLNHISCCNLVGHDFPKYEVTYYIFITSSGQRGGSAHESGFFYFLFLFRIQFSSVQFSSVSQPCPTLCDPMNRSTPGLPVHHHLLEFTQTHVHQVRDAIAIKVI